MKKIIILLTFLSIIIANAISFHIGNSLNSNLRINIPALLNAKADSESGTCFTCISDGRIDMGCFCAPEDPEPYEFWFSYFVDCWESPGGDEDYDRSCDKNGYTNCAGETYYTINTCD